jgi:hypothetical protein
MSYNQAQLLPGMTVDVRIMPVSFKRVSEEIPGFGKKK